MTAAVALEPEAMAPSANTTLLPFKLTTPCEAALPLKLAPGGKLFVKKTALAPFGPRFVMAQTFVKVPPLSAAVDEIVPLTATSASGLIGFTAVICRLHPDSPPASPNASSLTKSDQTPFGSEPLNPP